MAFLCLTDGNLFRRIVTATSVIRCNLVYLLLISVILCGDHSSCRLESLIYRSSSGYINLTSSDYLKDESVPITFQSLLSASDSLHTPSTGPKLIIPTSAKAVDISTEENLKETTKILDLLSASVIIPESRLPSSDKGKPPSLEVGNLPSTDKTLLISIVQDSTQKTAESITPSSSQEESSASVAEPLPIVPANDTLPETKKPSNLTSEPDAKVSTPDEEVMPSFDEWKKKKQAELTDGEKSALGAHPAGGGLSGTGTTNGSPINPVVPPGKKVVNQKRRRNYASYECGAKVLASNRQSEGAGRILNERMDEYMLNPCKVKIWFVIELCDTIQATQLELANFELFSSMPKEFTVSASDQYPTRDWSPLGTFVAQDQRTLHTFPLLQQGYGKFLRVELLSHYGKEHYCPLSVVRVFGTSMVDEFEDLEATGRAASASADEDDRPVIPSTAKTDIPNDIFGNAKKVVMTFISKAAQALGRESVAVPSGKEASPDSNLSVQSTTKTELFPEPKLRGEDDPQKCANHSLNELHRLALLCGFCISTSPVVHSAKCRFMWAVFNGSGIHALCLRAACQSDISLKANTTGTTLKQKLLDKSLPATTIQESILSVSESTKFTSSAFTGTVSLDSSRETTENIELTTNSSDTVVHDKTETLPSISVTNVETGSTSSDEMETPLQPSLIEPSVSTTDTVSTAPVEAFPEGTLPVDMSEDVFTEVPVITDDESRSGTRAEQTGVPISSTQKESVFVRLNNRIRLLEVNLSLSSQYLQELSQRYRKQMEDMQKAFNRTVGALNQTALRAAERDRHQQTSLAALQKQMEHITNMVEKLRLQNKTLYREVLETHLFIIAVEAIVVVTVMTLCWRRYRLHNIDPAMGLTQQTRFLHDEEQLESLGATRTPLKRHHSVCDLLMAFEGTKKRRPSESVSTAGTYSDLLIVEPAIPIYIEQPHKARRRHRNRKSKGNLKRSVSNPNVAGISEVPSNMQLVDQLSPISSPAAGVLFFPSQNTKGSGKCGHCSPVRTEETGSQTKVPFQNLTNPKVKKEESGAYKEPFSLRKLLKFSGKKEKV